MAGLPQHNNDTTLPQFAHLVNRPGLVSAHARAHWQQAQQLGWPRPRHEEWQYTSLLALQAQQLQQPGQQPLGQRDCDALALPLDAYRLVFVDGRFHRQLSARLWGEYQVEISEQLPEHGIMPEPIQPELFLHLAESLALQTTRISLAAGRCPARPLYLLHISSGQTGKGALNTVHYRHHLQLAAGADAQIIEHYVSLNAAPHFTGARLTVSVGAGARLRHSKLACEQVDGYHFAHNDLLIEQDAHVTSTNVLLGAGLTRHHSSVRLDGAGATLALNSLVLPVGNEVCDSRTYLEHNQHDCISRQLHKAIVSDSARAIFHGKIKVAPQALKTDGQMSNNNLLLGSRAEVDSRPQLEIYADDVKCSHGATVGRMADEQLFYLRSRGISLAAARQMMVQAFAADVIEAIDHPQLKAAVLARIAQRLADVTS